MSQLQIRSSIYDEIENKFDDDTLWNICSTVNISETREEIVFNIDPSICEQIREFGITKFPSISFMNKLNEWELALCLFLEDHPVNQNRNFFMSEFCEKTNLSYSSDKKTRQKLNQSFNKLIELNHISSCKKYEITKNGNTKFHFKRK